MSKTKSLYVRGRTCCKCGRHLDNHESFSMKIKDGKEIIVCFQCDTKEA